MYARLLFVSSIVLSCSLFLDFPASGSDDTSGPITPRIKNTIGGQRTSNLLRTDVRLVLVPVTVNDEFNRPVTDLTQDRFRITEDGVEQEITSFLWEDGPVSMGLL